MSGKAGRILYRFGPSAAGLLVYALFVLIWRCFRAGYEPLVALFDATPQRPPYGDMSAILQAGWCWRRGVDVYAPSACMHGGVFNYSPFMLRSVLLPFGPADVMTAGLVVACLFFLACAALPPALTPGALALRALAVCSGMVMYVLECGNFDAVVFVTLTAALCLLQWRAALSMAAYALFAFAAALKFYPAVLLGLALRESWARLALLGAAGLAGVIWFLLRYGQQSLFALATLPAGLPYRAGFSAMNIPFGLALLAAEKTITLDPDKAGYFATIATPHFASLVLAGTWGLTGLALLAAWRLADGFGAALVRLDESRRLFLVAGAMLIAFCYFAAQNYDYRGIFLIFTLPGLQALAALGEDRIPARWLSLAVLLLLWESPLRLGAGWLGHWLGPGSIYLRILVWLLRDALWWWLALCFAAIGCAELRLAWRRLFSALLPAPAA